MGLYSHAVLRSQQPIKCLFGTSGMLFTGSGSNPELKGLPVWYRIK